MSQAAEILALVEGENKDKDGKGMDLNANLDKMDDKELEEYANGLEEVKDEENKEEVLEKIKACKETMKKRQTK